MRKIFILSSPFLVFLLVMLVSSTNTKAQEQAEMKQKFENIISDESFMLIFNEGHIDSLATLYLDSACMMPDDGPYLYSKNDILDYYKYLYAQGFRFVGLKTRAYVLSGDLAVERGTWSMNMGPGVTFSGVYMTQWHYIDGRWFIENEMNRADGIQELNAMKE